MCKVSDKIKFCTCSEGEINIDELENYWILYRLKTEGFEILIGSFYLPNEHLENFELNKQTILKRLTETDAFDIPIEFKNEDILAIYLDKNKKWEDLVLSFRYKKRKWIYEQYDPLEIGGRYDQLKIGKFDNLIQL